MTLHPRVLSALATWLLTVSAASAVDFLYTRDGNVFSGEVARVEAQDIVLQIPQGEIPVHRSDIVRLEIARPPAYDGAVAALKAQRFAEALAVLKPLVARLGGLDSPWVQDAMLQLGDACVGVKDFAAAKLVFERFRALYPQSPKAVGTNARLARILVEQKSYGPASEMLQKMVQPLLAKASTTDAEELAAAEGLLLLGDCQQAASKPEEALDSYLTVITLFNVEPRLSAEAAYKAGQVFEQLKKWGRAKGTYQQLLKDWPSATVAADAKKRLAAVTEAHPEMTLWQAVVLGVTQGLTEFLPISSIAHLKIVAQLAGWSDPGAAFSAVIQLSLLASVSFYFQRELTSIARAIVAGLRHGQPLASPEARLGWMILAATVPILVLGGLFHHRVETSFRSLYVIAAAMIGLAILLILAEATELRRKRTGVRLKELSDLGWRDAIVVGLAQCAALVPGASRSGSTITGGLFLGMTRETAARFSFLLSIPAVTAAGVFELYKSRHALLASRADAVNLVAGTLVSAVVGYLAIAFLLGYLKKHTTWVFIIYRLAMGGLLLALLRSGHLVP